MLVYDVSRNVPSSSRCVGLVAFNCEGQPSGQSIGAALSNNKGVRGRVVTRQQQRQQNVAATRRVGGCHSDDVPQ